MQHVMLDLETWGTRPGSAIRSIGAVAFDPFYPGKFGAQFYANIRRASCFNYGLYIDPKTEAWWGRQDKAASDALESNQLPLDEALAGFSRWWVISGAEFVWCHGAGFDAVLLEEALRIVGMKTPWKYNAVRDTRTLFWLHKIDMADVPTAPGFIKHHALHDARHQALCVQEAMRRHCYPVPLREVCAQKIGNVT